MTRPSTLAPGTVVGGASAPRHKTWTLPNVNLRDVSRRLGAASLVFAVVFLVSLAVVGLSAAYAWAYALGLGLSLTVFALSRWGGIPPQKLLNAGLVYEVAVAFLAALIEHSDPTEGGRMHVSWVAVTIVAFPAIVPSTPRKTALAGFVAASLSPLAYVLTQAPGEPNPLSLASLPFFLANYLACCFALVPAFLFSELSEDIEEARDMGSYRLEQKLGEGGMGEVWRASHRALSRPAAVKMIPAELLKADAEMVEEFNLRFQREARATAALTSVHTVDLYDFGVSEDGSIYYVMELLEGTDMHHLVELYGPISPARTVHLLAQVCLSLAEAHQAGLIHRDIKPANIQLCRLGLQVDFVKVLDFGLVSAPPQEANLQLTAPNSVFGTPGFMSPEQAGGEPMDHRTDIYALGCVAYWLLSGKLVFRAESGMDSLVELYRRRPDPISQHAPVAIPPALDELVAQCLAKQPDERPATALELRRRLLACPLTDTWSEDEAAQWWKEHIPAKSPRV